MSNVSRISSIVIALLLITVPAPAQELPAGEGRDLGLAHCNSCHPATRVGAGYTPEGWRTVMQMMLNHGVVIPQEHLATMTAYLSKTFPEKGKPAGAVVPGPVTVSIT